MTAIILAIKSAIVALGLAAAHDNQADRQHVTVPAAKIVAPVVEKGTRR